MLEKVRCTECSWWGTWDQRLSAPSPFMADEIISGCPKCRSIYSLVPLCDEPGCTQEVVAGTSTGTGPLRDREELE